MTNLLNILAIIDLEIMASTYAPPHRQVSRAGYLYLHAISSQ